MTALLLYIFVDALGFQSDAKISSVFTKLLTVFESVLNRNPSAQSQQNAKQIF